MSEPGPATAPSTFRPLVPMMCATLAVIVAIVIAALLLTPGVVTTDTTSRDGSETRVTCASVAVAAWPRDLDSPSDVDRASGVSDISGGGGAYDEAPAWCASHRDGRLALSLVLGIGVSVLVTAAATTRRATSA